MEANRSLRLLNVVLGAAMVFFALGSILFVATIPSTLSGGGIGIDARVDPAFTVTRAAGSSLQVLANGGVRGGLTDGASTFKVEKANLDVNVRIPKRDRDTRVVLVVGFGVAIAGFWTGLIALRRLVRSAIDGEPFARRNVARLRFLSALVLGFGPFVAVCNRVLEATFASDALQPQMARVDIVPLLVLGLALFALAEVFRAGTALREFEATTI